MDLGILLDNKVPTDIELILYDDQNEITIGFHKYILYAGSSYFQKLFTTFAKDIALTTHRIEVPNAFIAHDIIISFYGKTTNIGNLETWQHLLESIKCYDYFGIIFDKSKFINLVIPDDGIELLLKVATDILNYDDILIDLVIDNVPKEYDVTTINKSLVQRILNYYNDNYKHNNILVTHDDKKEQIKIWDITSHKLLKTVDDVSMDSLNFIKMSLTHNNKFLINAHDHNTIKIYDINKNKLVKTLDAKLNWIRDIHITSDNKKLICLTNESTIYVWHFPNLELIYKKKYEISHLESMRISPEDDEIILSTYYSIHIVDLETGDVLKQIEQLNRHMRIVDKNIVTATDDSVTILYGNKNAPGNQQRDLDLGNRNYETHTINYNERINDIQICDNNKKLVIFAEKWNNKTKYNQVSVYDITNGNLLGEWSIFEHSNNNIIRRNSLITLDNKLIGRRYGGIIMLDLLTGKFVNKIETGEKFPTNVNNCVYVAKYRSNLVDQLKKLHNLP